MGKRECKACMSIFGAMKTFLCPFIVAEAPADAVDEVTGREALLRVGSGVAGIAQDDHEPPLRHAHLRPTLPKLSSRTSILLEKVVAALSDKLERSSSAQQHGEEATLCISNRAFMESRLPEHNADPKIVKDIWKDKFIDLDQLIKSQTPYKPTKSKSAPQPLSPSGHPAPPLLLLFHTRNGGRGAKLGTLWPLLQERTGGT